MYVYIYRHMGGARRGAWWWCGTEGASDDRAATNQAELGGVAVSKCADGRVTHAPSLWTEVQRGAFARGPRVWPCQGSGGVTYCTYHPTRFIQFGWHFSQSLFTLRNQLNK